MDWWQKLVGTIVLLGQAFYSSGVKDPTATLWYGAQEAGLESQYVIVEGWISLKNPLALRVLEQCYSCSLKNGQYTFLCDGEKLKLAIQKGRKNHTILSLQMITTDQQQAESMRRFWQQFADTWGNGEKIGITIAACAYKMMNAQQKSELCKELGEILQAKALSTQNIKTAQCVEFFSDILPGGIYCGGKQINANIVCTDTNQTTVYLAYPIVYQTY